MRFVGADGHPSQGRSHQRMLSHGMLFCEGLKGWATHKSWWLLQSAESLPPVWIRSRGMLWRAGSVMEKPLSQPVPALQLSFIRSENGNWLSAVKLGKFPRKRTGAVVTARLLLALPGPEHVLSEPLGHQTSPRVLGQPSASAALPEKP